MSFKLQIRHKQQPPIDKTRISPRDLEILINDQDVADHVRSLSYKVEPAGVLQVVIEAYPSIFEADLEIDDVAVNLPLTIRETL